MEIQYERNDVSLTRNKFRARGDVVEIFPAESTDTILRVEFFGDEIDRITEINALTGEVKANLRHAAIYPASHYIVPREKMQRAIRDIEAEMEERVKFFESRGKLIEAQRIRERTQYDMEMLSEIASARELKTTPACSRAVRPAARRARCSIISRRTSCSSWTNPT